jgi:general secretion pathway protein F
MPSFKYKAINAAGKTVGGVVEAESASLAGGILKVRGLVPLDVSPVARGGARKGALGWLSSLDDALRRRVPASVVTGAVRQLATLLAAGLPLDTSLATMIGKGRGGAMHQVLVQIRDHVREGGELASAFEQHPRLFGETFVTMVRAGEASGSLDIVMERLAEHLEQQLAMSRKIRATLAYPSFMLVVGIGVVAFLLAFVIPKITQIFVDMDRALPLPTQLLIAMSDILRGYWPLMLLFIGGVGALVWRFAHTPKGRRFVHKAMLRTPLVGRVVRLMAVGRVTKTLGLLLKNEVSLVPALNIVRSVAGNAMLEDVVARMHKGVQEGKSLWEFMEAAPIFPETAVQMVSAGERSGNLTGMLLVVAKDCENQVDSLLQVLMSLLEPVMILVMSVLVGFVVMAIILPIFEMSNLVG